MDGIVLSTLALEADSILALFMVDIIIHSTTHLIHMLVFMIHFMVEDMHIDHSGIIHFMEAIDFRINTMAIVEADIMQIMESIMYKEVEGL